METTPMNELESLAPFLRISEQLPGWIRGEEAEGLALTSLALPGSPVIVQIGTFFGSATVLLAGARRLRGTGKVHCVDPFDCSGDDFSVPHYRRLLAEAGNGPLRSHFESNIRLAGLEDWIEVHTGRAEEMIHGWTTSIDMLALGGDQSPAGARAAYEGWSPFLKPGGIIAIHNSAPREYAPTHDGNRRVVVEEIMPPMYTDIRLVVYTTFARRAS
jgi:predicted O-methyltransferase YrrM